MKARPERSMSTPPSPSIRSSTSCFAWQRFSALGATQRLDEDPSAHGALSDNLPWVLLELDALERSLADEAIPGPAGELGPDDELRAQPLGVAGSGAGHGRRER